jgi:hypothetical protein
VSTNLGLVRSFSTAWVLGLAASAEAWREFLGACVDRYDQRGVIESVDALNRERFEAAQR